MDDEPKNGSIQFYEFFNIFIEALGVQVKDEYFFKQKGEMKPLTCDIIVKHLQNRLGNQKIGLTNVNKN